MFEFLEYSFMVRALAAGLLLAIVMPLLGTFLVARRYSLIADSLAHVSLAGVSAGLLVTTTPLIVAVPVTVAGGLLLEYLRQRQRISGEASLAIMMSGGLALAVVLVSFAHNAKADFNSYLFGSITTTGPVDLGVLAVAAGAVVAVIACNYRALFHIAFDEDSARVAGSNVTLLNYLLAGMTALLVVLSMQIVGALLVGALLVIPVITASRLAKSFLQTIILAVIAAGLAVLIGLMLAFYVDLPAGGAIVLSALGLLLLAIAVTSRNR